MHSRLKDGVIRIALGMCLVLLVGGFMVAQDVQTNFMPGTDFSKFKTYKWVNIEGAQTANQIVDAQIKQAVDGQLATKGFTKTDADTADLYVGYQVAVTQQKEWNAYGMGGGPRWGGGFGGGGMATATSSTISVGTLAVDFYDPNPKQLVWRGTATKTLNPSKDPQKNQNNLNKAVAKLLKDFPPKPGK